MNVVITGAGGFLGSCVTRKLIAQNGIYIDNKKHPITSLLLVDQYAIPHSYSTCEYVHKQICDLSDASVVCDVLKESHDVVLHLAAVVSGQAEMEFELGYKANVTATVNILNAIKNYDTPARFFMTSSLAVFGYDVPAVVPDNCPCLPVSSYGTQKAICELYTLDYSRKGYCDGRILRLPTITVRRGIPNAAASSFISSIIREPLQGKHAVCPVPRDVQLWIMSPNDAIDSILYMVNLPQSKISQTRIIHPIGLTVSVQEMIDALVMIGGKEAYTFIAFNPDKSIEDIVLTWPSRFSSHMARKLGFPQSKPIEDIIKEFYVTL